MQRHEVGLMSLGWGLFALMILLICLARWTRDE